MDQAGRRIQLYNQERLAPDLDRGFRALEQDRVPARIWGHDWTLWKAEDKEITNRLGWLASPWEAEQGIPDMEAFAASVRGEGLTRAVVLGMGGSSLAPEVFARMFPTAANALDLEVLDTTEPRTVAAAEGRLDLRETLFLVSSKSGTTAELVALLSFFYDRARRELGERLAGSRFAAITDPGTPLDALARNLGFRRVFHGRPDIGGRFSALSAFGLLPAALKGVDLKRLLSSAQAMAAECRAGSAADNPGAFLGAVLGTAAVRGLDKLTILVPPRLRPLAGWLEQLVAESTGKDGRGIVPVIEDGPGPVEVYGGDRLFVHIGASGGPAPEPELGALVEAGLPLVRLGFDEPCDLGAFFFLWEFATAVAAHFLEVNPFDQPDVESTKKKTRQVLAGPGGGSAPDIRIAGPPHPAGAAEALAAFFGAARDGDYLAVLAFLPPRAEVRTLLEGLAGALRRRYRRPVTVGFGPRYLHSTGQLHKGDGNRGLFLMLTGADLPEVPIPETPGMVRPAATFADLFRAQASGDRLALEEKGRRVMAVELSGPIEPAVGGLTALLK